MPTKKKREEEKSGKVTITYDESVIRKTTKTAEEIAIEKLQFEEDNKNAMKGANAYTRQGTASSNGKFERMHDFIDAFDNGKFVTIQAASLYFGLGWSTCKKYADELHIMIFDDHKREWTEGRKPKYIH